MQKPLTKAEKIIACYKHVNIKSIARMCNTSVGYVRNIIAEYKFTKPSN